MLAAMALVTGCATSDLRLVGDAKAAEIWNEARYRASCVGTGGPPAYCPTLQKALSAANADVVAADAAQKVGRLTPSAIGRLKAIPAELEAIR